MPNNIIHNSLLGVVLSLFILLAKFFYDKYWKKQSFQQENLKTALNLIKNEDRFKLLKDYIALQLIFDKKFSYDEIDFFEKRNFDPQLINDYGDHKWYLSIKEGLVTLKERYYSTRSCFIDLFMIPIFLFALALIEFVFAYHFSASIIHSFFSSNYNWAEVTFAMIVILLAVAPGFIFLILVPLVIKEGILNYHNTIKYWRNLPPEIKSNKPPIAFSSILITGFLLPIQWISSIVKMTKSS